MRRVANSYIIVLILFMTAVGVAAQDQTALSASPQSLDKLVHAGFEGRVREYTQKREELERELPPLAKQATAKEIAAHKDALLKKVLAHRKGVVRVQIFTPESEKMIRTIIVEQYPGRDRLELKKELAEAENKTVAVKVNAVYPEAAELLEMPATLLQVLPELPKQVRYRFVGNNLLIVDRENHLIVDYMANALP